MAKRRDEDRQRRQAAIAQMAMDRGTLRIEELASEFQVSPMTIHRDLDALAAVGLLRKTRGSVTAMGTNRHEASTEYRIRLHVAEKKAVAEAALEFVNPGDTIILDDSTTGILFARMLLDKQPLTVITNFQPVIDELLGALDIAVISLGGQFYPWCSAYMGAVTLTALSEVRADTLFMSTSAIIDDTCFHQHHDTILVKKAAFKVARRRILYVDHSKFDNRALNALLPLRDFDAVILDDRTPTEHVTRLRRSGVNLILAPVQDEAGSALDD